MQLNVDIRNHSDTFICWLWKFSLHRLL